MVCLVAIKPQPVPFCCSSSLSSVLTTYIISGLTSPRAGHPYDSSIAASTEVVTRWVDPFRRISARILHHQVGWWCLTADGTIVTVEQKEPAGPKKVLICRAMVLMFC